MAKKRTKANGPAEKRTRPPNPSPVRLKDFRDRQPSSRKAQGATPTVVAVGASAGGLDAFSQILERLTPSPNVAFVFVQHLSPQHESALPTLLSARTSLPVVQATDGVRIESNHIYVMPPNVQMEVIDGHLHLLPRPHDRSQFTPIDFFFESFARWAQQRAIGVILSGTASDGAIGIREIKAVGGITIAQKQESAKYDGMPRAAIATGMIDLVLTPKEIAEHISHVRDHPYIAPKVDGDVSEELTASNEQFQDLFTLLRRASGIDFKQYKTPTVKRRLLRRMALHRLTDVGAYLRYLREHPPEATALCHDLLIHVTRFFRDPDSFKVLETDALPEIAHERSDEPIRIWVPGCATGEESYSVAIVLMEALGERASDRKVQIFATDVSETAIDQARAGAYPSSIAADVTPERLSRFFTKNDGGYRISKILRDMCVFARHDLGRDPPFSRLDLIMCRNVLIYLDAALQKRLMSVFHYGLKNRGFLMLGSAETTGPEVPFTLVDKKWRLYRKPSVESFVTFALPQEPVVAARAPSQARAALRPEGRPVLDEANRVLLDKYGPPGVLVDASLEIVHFRGQTGPYLESAAGDPSLNVLKMARGGLLHPLRSTIGLARRKHRPTRKENILIQHNGGWKAIDLEVVPLAMPKGEYFLILFETPAAAPRKDGKAGKASRFRKTESREAPDGRVGDLRRELLASREYLQSIIQELEAANEELQSANEEILSSNEELQSTNEELDTAKEELQSTNEELNTVNEELHSRNEELARVNSDLMNLLGSVDLPIVIVGDDMSIRRFTPAAERVFNLISGDVGRPIGQVNPNISLDNLESLIRTTIDGVNPQEQAVRDRDGRPYSLRIRPYKSIDNRLDGAVITAIAVADTRPQPSHVQRSRNHFAAIIDTLTQPVLFLDGNLRIRAANEAFCKTFDVTPEAIDGAPVYDISDGRWNTYELRKLLTAASTGEATHYIGVKRHPSEEGTAQMMVKVRGLELDDASQWILMTMEIKDA